MVIDRQRFPILEALESCPRMGFINSFEPLNSQPKEVLERIGQYHDGTLNRKVEGNVKLITDTFSTAMENSMSAFEKIDYRQFAAANIEGSGCLIFGYSHPNVVFYFREGNILEFHHFIGEKGCIISSMISVDLLPCPEEEQFDYVPEGCDESNTSKTKVNLIYLASQWMERCGVSVHEYVYSLITRTILFFIFEKYAQVRVETETISARKKTRSKIYNDKVSNAFHFDVHLRDCTWFTSIFRKEDYKVRGHLRLQPCGKNHQDRELIYISEYVKHGYSRKARLERESTDK